MERIQKIEERINKRIEKINKYEDLLKEEKRLLKKDKKLLAHIKYDELLKTLMDKDINQDMILKLINEIEEKKSDNSNLESNFETNSYRGDM